MAESERKGFVEKVDWAVEEVIINSSEEGKGLLKRKWKGSHGSGGE